MAVVVRRLKDRHRWFVDIAVLIECTAGACTECIEY